MGYVGMLLDCLHEQGCSYFLQLIREIQKFRSNIKLGADLKC